MGALENDLQLIQADGALLELMSCAIWFCAAPDGAIGRYNRRAVELWGREPRAGETLCAAESLEHPDGRRIAAEDSPIAAALASGEEQRAELVVRRAGAFPAVARVRVVPVRDADGTLSGALALFDDVTEQRQTEALLRGQKAALEGIARGEPLARTLESLARIVEERAFGRAVAGILLLDAERRLRHGAAPSLPDSYNAAVDGLAIAPDLGTCAAAAYRNEVIVTEDIENARSWAPIKHLPLGIGLLAAWSQPIVSSSGEVLGTFGTYFRERRCPTDEERQVVGLLAHTAAIAIEHRRRDEADALASRRKDEFLAMLAHELRNPLAAISSAGELLNAHPDPGVTAQAADVVSRQSATMATLLSDLLDVSRITRGEIVLERRTLDLGAVVHAALGSLREAGLAGNHAWDVRLPPHPVTVEGDAVRLEQALSNLFSNAVRYTPPGGRIAVEVTVAGAQASLHVRDTGDGIAPEFMPRLFDLFTRGASHAQAVPGLGVGLAVVRRIVELHGGCVRAASEGAGRGSEFTIELPRSAARGIASQVPAPVRAVPRRIVLIEDQEDVAAMLQGVLAERGHTVKVARDGVEGLALLLAEAPDFALIDIGLPRMNGYELVRRAKDEASLKDTVFVALTGYGSPTDVLHALDSGFAHHLVKPVDSRALERLLTAARR